MLCLQPGTLGLFTARRDPPDDPGEPFNTRTRGNETPRVLVVLPSYRRVSIGADKVPAAGHKDHDHGSQTR